MQQIQDKFLNGQIILIDKPLKWTSFDVVKKIHYQLRKNLDIKKIKVGHAGTLDPLATGLLIVCTGKFTKKIDEIQAQTKEYTGTITIGATTPSFDLEKEVDEEFPVEHITEVMIKETAKSFIGEQQQTAPIHSAKKIDGKRAYEYARSGEEVEIKSNLVTIKSFEVLGISNHINELKDVVIIDENYKNERINLAPNYEKGLHVKFKITCSKGTYIRSIARDFGIKLNSGAHLSELRRTKIGDFDVKNALSNIDINPLITL
ncbi:MAG: tRNA pseudouridine(55) synthase TruB [Bacteroidetes bacterium]|nr:tRNA pseudouridine(55) synthase TruB [Bacteroidota bacterium]